MDSLKKSTGKKLSDRSGRMIHSDRATSPSVLSTSTEDEGGARLDACMDALCLEDSPAAPRYTHPHPRQIFGSPVYARDVCGPSAKGSPGFQVGTDLDDDGDVFTSPNKRPIAALTTTEASGAVDDCPVVTPARTTPLTPQGLVGTPSGEYSSPLHRTLRYRTSDLGSRHQVGGVDAQSFYPPTACVFVANLPEGVKDSRLEVEVTRHFSKFGIVFVKIRRDQKNMPFAFCQYTKDDDAKVAMTQGRGTVIHGRACRTEMVKANRSYVMYTCNGGHLSVEEARKVLAPFGPLSKCEPLDTHSQDAMSLGAAVLVEFTTFDPSRDIQAAFRHHASYRVMAYDPKKSMQSSKVDTDEAWLQRYEVERRSIYIGNLPVDDDDLESKIKAVVDEIGDVMSVQVIHKEGKNGRPIAFSFVEFARPDMAEIAVNRLSGAMLFGSNLRVERKAGHNAGPSNLRRVRSNLVLSDAYSTPVRDQRVPAQQQVVSPLRNVFLDDAARASRKQDAPVPSTPLRATGPVGSPTNNENNTVSSAPAPMGVPYWMAYTGQNYASPNYTTSPFTGQIGGGMYPVSPQGALSPYTSYYPAPYPAAHWATQYMADPSLGSMTYYPGYGQTMVSTSHAGDDAPDTPTKPSNTGSGDANESQSGGNAA